MDVMLLSHAIFQLQGFGSMGAKSWEIPRSYKKCILIAVRTNVYPQNGDIVDSYREGLYLSHLNCVHKPPATLRNGTNKDLH
jgi:hypothetical protein